MKTGLFFQVIDQENKRHHYKEFSKALNHYHKLCDEKNIYLDAVYIRMDIVALTLNILENNQKL